MKLLEALETKPLSPHRKPKQLLSAIVATSIIKDMEVRSTLLEKVIDHISQDACMALFSPEDAFSAIAVLVFRKPSPQIEAKWTTAVCTFAQRARQGNLHEISTQNLLQCLVNIRRCGKHLLVKDDVKRLLLRMMSDRKRLEGAPVATVLQMVNAVVRFSGASQSEKGKVIKSMIAAIKYTQDLSTLPPYQSARLMVLAQEFDLMSEFRELKSALEQNDRPSRSSHDRARALESMMGSLDD